MNSTIESTEETQTEQGVSRAGDDADRKESRDQLILDHLPLVRIIALRVRDSLPAYIELDDMIHAGVLGLIRAATKFSADRGVPFRTYAQHRIRGAILDSLRQVDWATRDTRRKLRTGETVARNLASHLERMPTESEIAAEMGVAVERWRKVTMEAQAAQSISMSEVRGKRQDPHTLEVPATAEFHPENAFHNEQLREVLAGVLQKLPQRQQQVIAMYYVNDMTMTEIGKCLAVNESRISQIHRAALDKLAVLLQSTGIHSANAILAA